MANTTFSGPVRSEAGFQVATKNSTTGAITTRYSSVVPDLTGLSLADVATAGAITLAADTISYVDYTGAAACVATLPAATAGTVVVYAQAVEPSGGVNTLTFDAAGTDVIATGSIIESRASDEVSFDSSTANETSLVYTPVDASTNIFTVGAKIYFVCFSDGTWNIGYHLPGVRTKGAFAFAA